MCSSFRASNRGRLPYFSMHWPKKKRMAGRKHWGISLSSRYEKRRKEVIRKILRTENYSQKIYKHGRSWDQSPLHWDSLSPPPRSPPTTWKSPFFRTSAHLTLLEQLFQTTGPPVDGLELEKSLPRSPEIGKGPFHDWMGKRKKNKRAVWVAAKAVTGMVLFPWQHW